MKTLIKNGLVYDGNGKKPVETDILVEDNIIIEINKNIEEPEIVKVIDCDGLCVAPGFIDAHSHNDFFCDYDNAEVYFQSFIEQGITTQITGNCGFSPFGVKDDSLYKSDVGAGLFAAKRPGSFKDFCERVEGKLYVNIVPLIGHGTTRISVSGLGSKALSKQQINEEMKLVEEAMDNGAFGGSFGFMYEPGMYAQKDELVEFAKTVAKHDGIVTVHPRACSKVAMGYPLISKPHIELALDEVIDIMEKSKVHMEYSHLIFVGQTSWKSIDPMLKKFYEYRAKGYDIAYDNYSFTYGASVITVVCPPWYMALSKEQRKKSINRLKLRVVINMTKKLLGIDFSDITVAYISPEHKQYEGRKVDEIASSEGKDCLDKYLELIDESNGAGKVYLEKYYNDDLIKRLMEDELSIFMTDAWIEPEGVQNGAAYQCFPNFIDKAKKYDIPLEKVINKMTKATADRYDIKKRGEIKIGNYADLTIFDLDSIKVDLSNPTFKPEGIKFVIINGETVVDDGKYISKTVGQMIKKT